MNEFRDFHHLAIMVRNPYLILEVRTQNLLIKFFVYFIKETARTILKPKVFVIFNGSLLTIQLMKKKNKRIRNWFSLCQENEGLRDLYASIKSFTWTSGLGMSTESVR